MHKHDLDLIAEYAQGTLAEESRTRALVESCETCRAEFQSQQTALQTLASIAPAHMTDQEKAALHRDLWTELRDPTGTHSKTGRARWQSWAFGAAALVFVGVGLVGVLSNLSGEDAVTATFSEIGPALGGDDFSAPSQEGESDATSSESTSAQDESFERSALGLGEFQAIARRVRDQTDADLQAYEEGFSERTDDGNRECLTGAGLDDYEPVLGFENETDLLIATPMGAARATTPVAFVDPETCTLIHLED